MSAKLQAIRDACALDPALRTEEQVSDILEFVKDVKFFTKLSAAQQRALCRTMTREEFAPKDIIFKKDDLGDKFYIILAGSVGVQVPSQSAPCPNGIHAVGCDCPNRPLETLIFLEKGAGFGELALQSKQPRSATIVTSETTECLVTTRGDYEAHAGQLHRQFIEQRVKFLRSCPRIEDALQMGMVSTQDIAAMANCLNEGSIGGNQMVVRQGQQVEHMIFVRSGRLAMLKSIDLDACREEAQQSPPASPRRGADHEGDKKDRHGAPVQGEAQHQLQLATNIAKAMMDMKKQERRSKLAELMKRSSTREAAFLSEAMGPSYSKQRSSVSGLPPPPGPPAPPSPPSPQPSTSAPADADPATDAATSGATSRVASKAKAGAARVSNSQEGGTASRLWSRLRTGVNQAKLLSRIVAAASTTWSDPKPPDDKAGQVFQAQQSVEHFASVSAARRRFVAYQAKQLIQVHGRKKQDTGDSPAESRAVPGASPAKARVRLLNVGSIGPFQYFGDKQVGTNQVYPVSLVSDPIAEIYLMSKHDILRRLPKKLFSALFAQDADLAEPTNLQLLDMLRQTERWSAFRERMQLEAHGRREEGKHLLRTPPVSASRGVDPAANLEFLGVNLDSTYAQMLMRPPRIRCGALTLRDEEHFSQASARFLRRCDLVNRDPGLRLALTKAGVSRPKSTGKSKEDEERDPMAFKFEQHWATLRRDPIALDLGDDLAEEDFASPIGGPAATGAGGPGSGPGSRGRSGAHPPAQGRRASLNGPSGSSISLSSGAARSASKASSAASRGSVRRPSANPAPLGSVLSPLPVAVPFETEAPRGSSPPSPASSPLVPASLSRAPAGASPSPTPAGTSSAASSAFVPSPPAAHQLPRVKPALTPRRPVGLRPNRAVAFAAE